MNASVNNTFTNKEQAVTNLQRYLRRLSFERDATGATGIPRPPIDGIFDSDTENAVSEFQRVMGLPQTGIADKTTWDMIFEEYMRVTEGDRLAQGLFIFPDSPKNYTISKGDALTLVRILQLLLLELRAIYDIFEDITENGIYDDKTESAIRDFQASNLLPVTGEVDKNTWNRIVREYANLSTREDS
ncbi:MAG: peptidoglycan-binding protein [Clostridia bacterium]|nr:peptidoglycan-binding protein [Clostridia bacterium]